METGSSSRLTAIRTYRQRRPNSLSARARRAVRDALILGLSIPRSIPRSGNWIRFPYYHFVFDDERAGFARQLRYLRNFGDLISLDDAAEHLGSDSPRVGRYFCVTFDDGFKNHLANAAPILSDLGVVAAFFVPTRYIGMTAQQADAAGFYRRLMSPPVEMMTWDDCRRLAAAGMTIGSHTVNHNRLSDLSAADVARELRESKAAIEHETGGECLHFCAPYGMPGDFDAVRDPELARQAGFRTFLTTTRGSLERRPQPFAIERDLMVAAWPIYQLRYFFSR